MKIEYVNQLDVIFLCIPGRNNCRWELSKPFFVSVDGDTWTVPKGFYTDFASVPRFLWPLISPYDLGMGPVAHDAGYFFGWRSRAYWDAALLSCMEHDAVPRWKRVCAYAAVRLFAGGVWRNYRKQGLPQEQLNRIIGRNLDGLS